MKIEKKIMLKCSEKIFLFCNRGDLKNKHQVTMTVYAEKGYFGGNKEYSLFDKCKNCKRGKKVDVFNENTWKMTQGVKRCTIKIKSIV